MANNKRRKKSRVMDSGRVQDNIVDYVGAGYYDDYNPNADLSHIKITHTVSDTCSISCSHCGVTGASHVNLGVMSINGLQRDIYKCESCNNLFDFIPNSVKAFIDEAKQACGTENISFSRKVRGLEEESDSGVVNRVEEELRELDTFKNDMRMYIEELKSIITEQQQEIQEIKEDPLRALKETVNAFNLR